MERNAEDFAAKYEKVYQDMFRFALYTLKNRHEAEDVVSETVLDAWKGIEGLKTKMLFVPGFSGFLPTNADRS